MTIRLLTPWGPYPINANVDLGSATEQSLVTGGVASEDLTGGVPYAGNPDDPTAIALREKTALIKAERDHRVTSGGYLADGHWFHSDPISRTQQMGLVLMGSNIPAGLRWKAMDGSMVPMTPALAQAIFMAAAAADAAHFAVCQAALAAVQADPTGFDPATILWPATYR